MILVADTSIHDFQAEMCADQGALHRTSLNQTQSIILLGALKSSFLRMSS